MNRFAGLFLALLVPLAVLHAQPRGKVAIVRSPHFPTALDTVVKAESIEAVEVDTALPPNLDAYDALFIQEPDNDIDSATQSRLVRYIDSGGKLYVQASERVTDSTDSTNPLWLRFGIKRNVYTALSFSVNSIHGVDSEFTKNIFDSLPMDVYQSGLGGPIGPIIPILVADGDGCSILQHEAYISEDASLRMVYSEASNYDYPGYYSEFISDVICGYFHLCAEDIKITSQLTSQDNFSIIHDERNHGFSVSAHFTAGGEVSVLNTLGSLLWHENIRHAATLVELPDNLVSGVYFISVRSGNKRNVQPFAIVN